MSGNQIIDVQQPNRGALFAKLISDMIGQHQQQQQQQDDADKKRQQLYLAELIKANPAHAQEIMRANPDAFEGVNYDPSQFAPTQDETFHNQFMTRATQAVPTLPQGVMQQGAYQIGTGAPMPQDSVKLTNQQDVTGNPQSWTPEVQQNAAIEAGRAMNADQRAVTTETTRHNVVEEGQTGPLRKAQSFEATSKGQEAQAGIPLKGAQTKEALAKAAAASVGGTPEFSKAVDDLVNRRASLDDFAKKGTPQRQQLIDAMPKGIIAPNNEKERGDLVSANNTASLMQDRITKLRQLAPVADSLKNRAFIAALLDAPDGKFSAVMKGMARNVADPKVLDYIQELRNLREDQFALRKYLGNSPVRSDKQVNIMLSQSLGTDAGSSKDVLRMLDAFEPAVNKLVIGTQGGGRPVGPTQTGSGATSGPKVGDTKKFPNGQTGVWDGHGWAQQ